jgi:hypothetical protein
MILKEGTVVRPVYQSRMHTAESRKSKDLVSSWHAFWVVVVVVVVSEGLVDPPSLFF